MSLLGQPNSFLNGMEPSTGDEVVLVCTSWYPHIFEEILAIKIDPCNTLCGLGRETCYGPKT